MVWGSVRGAQPAAFVAVWCGAACSVDWCGAADCVDRCATHLAQQVVVWIGVERRHRPGRPQPCVDGLERAAAKRAVIGHSDVGAQPRDLVKERVLCKVATARLCARAVCDVGA
eukprot:201720-Chlamydomonas_euryale.AAC.4